MRLQNTLTGEVEDLAPVVPGKVGIYVCGVTPYDSAHVGHAMSLIVYDVLVRYLRWPHNSYGGLEVTFVSNYTDVDDKLIDRGAQMEVDPLDLANRNIAQWEDEQERLGLLKPDVRPRVSLEIENIIGMTEEIVAHGYGYVTPSGDVYFRVRAKADYGKLSHRNIEDLRTGTRFEPGEEKEFPLDFALWKAAKPGEPASVQFDSPWGKGRPGWHIECSAMSRRYLYPRSNAGTPGATDPDALDAFDIHGGGLDLIFPHHENEIAQAEAAANRNDHVFARLWMHNGMVQRDGEKMSKSLGNVVNVEDALRQWSPDAIRLFVLMSHYRSRNNLTDEAMAAAGAGIERLTNALRPAEGSAASTIDLDAARTRFVEAMEDDLGTPEAMAVLFDLARAINRGRDAGEAIEAAQTLLREVAGVLGLTLAADDIQRDWDTIVEVTRIDDMASEYLGFVKLMGTGHGHTRELVDALIRRRAEARATRDFDTADRIRRGLEAAGIVIEDTPQGARWSVKR